MLCNVLTERSTAKKSARLAPEEQTEMESQESVTPTATLVLSLQSQFWHCVDVDDHSYCTYVFPGILDIPRHSLETRYRCNKEERNGIDKQSLFAGTNNHNNPPLSASNIDVDCFSPNYTTNVTHHRQRSLIASTTSFYNEMTAFVTEAPGSPPGLTGSRSSKSSSFHSSSLSGTEGILSDVTHFEDIGLDEDNHSFHAQNFYGMEKPLHPLPRNAITTTNGARASTASTITMRELTNTGKGPPFPRSPGPFQNHAPTHSLSLPYGKGPGSRRGLRSPSTPSLAITAMSNRNRSRSPSPNTTTPLARPIPSPKSPKRPGLAPMNNKALPVRRGSWQPSRKSIKELEAEYDDLDEDLPEDASLWNVPLSPRPPTERTPVSPSVSPKASPSTSPERPRSLRTPIGLPSSHGPRTAPPLNVSSPLSRSLDSPPASPEKKRSLVRGASTGAMPDDFSFPGSRTKSWNVALSELSEDAKTLTEAFENYAVVAEQKHEEAIQNGDTVARLRGEKLSRAKTSTVELPPLRINNVMVDPLPISKEKEKVLSRTRPSWLPPKSQKEEKKHLKEYQRMMEFSLEAGMKSVYCR